QCVETRIKLEQAAIEQSRGHIGDGFHLLEAGLHQAFLFSCHLSLLLSRALGRATNVGAKLQTSLSPITTYAGRRVRSSGPGQTSGFQIVIGISGPADRARLWLQLRTWSGLAASRRY